MATAPAAGTGAAGVGRRTGWAVVVRTTVPAGRFDTINIYRFIRFDDAEFWRSGTSRRDSIWYAAAVKAPVKENREGTYVETTLGNHAQVRSESIVIELVSFRPSGR